MHNSQKDIINKFQKRYFARAGGYPAGAVKGVGLCAIETAIGSYRQEYYLKRQ
jgi:hypothetical protein